MTKKVSIIVPTYNVEQYIEKCLDSLVNQSSKDFVAYIINDGSPANEVEIVKPYTEKYPFIKSIVKQNGGYGSVLNKAIELVDSPYFLICDPDDYLRYDAVENLIKLIEENNVDLVIGAKQLVYSDNEETKYDPSYNPDFAQLNDKMIYNSNEKSFEQLFFVEPSPHAKLYKTEMVKKIVFPEKVSYTDNLLYYISLLQCETVLYTSDTFAYYLINREGNTRTDLRPNVIDHWVKVITEILIQSQKFKEIPSIFYFRMFESFKFVFNKIDFIKANEQELHDRLFSTRQILDLLILHKDEIISQFGLSQSTGKERRNDLLLLDSSKYRKVFDTLANKKLYRLKHGSNLKAKLKEVIFKNDSLSALYNKYHFFAKYIYTKKNPKVVLHPLVSLKVIDTQGQTFFGYYNRSAERNGNYLYHRINSRNLSLKQEVEICVNKKVVGKSKAWNWQQGSMTNWLSDNEIIFNDYENGKYVSKIVNINTLESQTINFPIYSVSSDSQFALTLNFIRLAKYRPDYGYINISFDQISEYDENDGISIIDLITNSSEILIDFKTLKNFQTIPSMENAIHKVNHIDLSPDNNKFIFLHRWIKDDVKYTRLFEYSFESKTLKLLSDNKMVSHCYWEDNETIIAFLKGPNNVDGYYRIHNGEINQILKDLADDGHPSTKEGYLVTDSYPDYRCYQTLWLSKTPYTKPIQLGLFYSGFKFNGHKRCDLHPRWNFSNRKVTLDTVYSGSRQIVELDLNQVIED